MVKLIAYGNAEAATHGFHFSSSLGFSLAQFPIIDLALSGVIAIVGRVTRGRPFPAKSTRIDLALSIAS